MPTPETLTPDRAERLVAGDMPETSREAVVAGLVRELRAGAAEPSEALRERVAALRAPAARPRRRRTRLVLAVALLALAAIAAAAMVLPGAEPRRAGSADLVSRASGEAEDLERDEQPNAVPTPAPALEFAAKDGDVPFADGTNRASALSDGLAGDPARARDVDLALELRVADAEAVSEATNGAMRAVRELGGHVVSSDISTNGEEGSARLRVAVPTRRLEDAVVAISALGTVTAQRLAIEDLQGSVDRRSNRIEALERAIRRDEIRLASSALSPDERLRVELRLENLRGQLRYAKRERAKLLREAAFAELTVELHTREARAGAAPAQGRIERAARDGLAALASATSVAVFLLVLAGPLLVLAALALAFRRRRVRRANEALLDRPGAVAS